MRSDVRSTAREIILNEYWDRDVDYAINYTKWLLSLLGIWPMVSSNVTKTQLYFSKLVMAIVCSLMIFVTVPSLAHLLLREKDRIARIMLIGPLGFCVANILKYASLIYRRDAIKVSVSHMEADWKSVENESDRMTMKRNVRVGRNLTVVSGVFLYACTLCYHLIMPLCSGKTTNEFNETVRNLVFPGYDIFVEDRIRTYEFVLYTCFLASCVNSAVSLTSCNLAATLVSHACGQFQIVVSRLETLLDSVNDRNNCGVQERIKSIIRTHVRVLGFSAKIEEILREICCVEVIASTLIICLDEYYCMTEWKNSETLAILTYVGVLISMSFNIFIFCHIGELLKEQCAKIERAAYMSDWWKLHGRNGLSIVMIIGTGNYPANITAGRMMELSIESFGSIMKNTLAYLNMLRTIGY